MCGFVGFVSTGNGAFADADDLVRASDAIRHRGPDDGGVWLAEGGQAGFGFRRLSILDLSAHGHQPMSSACGRYTIVFNGEVYNFNALRADLGREQAHTWQGHSDTEVLLELIRRHGINAALSKLDGMFAIALWDGSDKTLTLARDRFGEKPLYWGRSDGGFVFGSELKALKALPGFKADLDRDALALYFRYRYVPGARSIYQAYRKLEAGHVLVLKDGQETVRPYWRAEDQARSAFAEPFAGDRTAALDEIDRLFKASVEDRLESDVPLGTFLSGGVDSSLAVAYAQQVSNRPVNTFTIAFEHEHFNEAPYAAKVAQHLGAHHTEIMVTERDALDMVAHLPAMYDEPFADPSQLPTAVLCAKAKDHVTVALAGDGGDELFCGYGRYLDQVRRWQAVESLGAGAKRRAARIAASWPTEALDALSGLGGLRGKPGKLGRKWRARWVDRSATDAEEFFMFASSFWRDGVPVLGVDQHERALFAPPTLDLGPVSAAERFQVLDTGMYLPDDVLVKTDRASMAASLEVRTPFLNADLACFAWSLPFAMYDPETHGLKVMLKELLARYVPRDLFERPKMGFDAPIRQWLRGDLKAWGESLVFDPSPLATEYLDLPRIQIRWRAHQNGENGEGDLWPALVMLAWMREC